MTKTTFNNGSDKKYVHGLYQRVRDAVDMAYKIGQGDVGVLRDWARNKGHRDRFEAMLDREKRSEREHRGWGPDWAKYHGKITVEHAALVILLSNIGDGATRTEPVTAEMFLTMREGCAEAMQIGYLARHELSQHELINQLLALDYSEVVKK
jgi:hypothetical protein